MVGIITSIPSQQLHQEVEMVEILSQRRAQNMLIAFRSLCGDGRSRWFVDGWLRPQPILYPNWLVVSKMCYFPFHIWDVILPIDELHHFSRWYVKTTKQPICWDLRP